MYKILILDDNIKENENERKMWAQYNGVLTTVLDVQEMIIAMSKDEYHMLVLVEDYLQDRLLLALSALNGLSDLPIMILTSSPSDTIHDECARRGAVAYMKIPGQYESAVVRGLAVIKQFLLPRRNKSLRILGDNGLLICIDFKRVLLHGQMISLTRTEYDMLLYIVENKGRTLTFEQILNTIWGAGYENGSRNSVWNAVKRLKKKLYAGPDKPEYIVNVFNVGYRYDPYVLASKSLDSAAG